MELWASGCSGQVAFGGANQGVRSALDGIDVKCYSCTEYHFPFHD